MIIVLLEIAEIKKASQTNCEHFISETTGNQLIAPTVQ